MAIESSNTSALASGNLPGAPSVAVLLAAYNGMENIAEQVASILNQSDVNVSLFISVDLSSDDTYAWCKNLEQGHANIHVLDYGERYGGASKNFFRLIRDVDFSNFDFVALSDQDDIWLPAKLQRAVSRIREFNLNACSADVIAFWRDGRRRLVKKSYPQRKFDYLFEAAGPGCSYVFTAESLLKFKRHLVSNWGVINQAVLHDWVIYAYYRNMGMPWLIDDMPLLLYRQHADNQVGVNMGLSAFIKRWLLVKDKWARQEVELVRRATRVADKGPANMNKLFLIKNFLHLRRRKRDAFALLVMIVLGLY